MSKTKRTELRGGIGLILGGLAFLVATIVVGNQVEWDLGATIGGGYRYGPAWLALPGGIILGLGGVVIGPFLIRQSLQPEPPRPPHARRLEGVDGRPLPLESDE